MEYYPRLVWIVVWIMILSMLYILWIGLVYAGDTPVPIDGDLLSPWHIRVFSLVYCGAALSILIGVLRARLWAYYVLGAWRMVNFLGAVMDAVRGNGVDVETLLFELVILAILVGYLRDFRWVARRRSEQVD